MKQGKNKIGKKLHLLWFYSVKLGLFYSIFSYAYLISKTNISPAQQIHHVYEWRPAQFFISRPHLTIDFNLIYTKNTRVLSTYLNLTLALFWPASPSMNRTMLHYRLTRRRPALNSTFSQENHVMIFFVT